MDINVRDGTISPIVLLPLRTETTALDDVLLQGLYLQLDNINRQAYDDMRWIAELKMISFRRGTIDLLVRFSADSKLLGPTKLKNHLGHFIFLFPPTHTYLCLYWAHKSRSPIKIYRI